MKDKEELTTYCGLYCPACSIFQGRIGQAVDNLQNLIGAYGLDKASVGLAKVEPAFANYDKFVDVMAALKNFYGSCEGCRNGAGPPDCKIRDCASDRGYSMCVDCPEMEKCDTLKKYPWALPSLRRIRDLGYEKWMASMDKKVKGGWSYLHEK